MDLEMNRISSEVTPTNARKANQAVERKFAITLTIVIFVGVICLSSFHGTYFWSKNKLHDRYNRLNYQTVNRFSEKSAKAELIVTDFVSTLPLSPTSLHILVIDSHNSKKSLQMTKVFKSQDKSRLLKFTTDRVINSRQIIVFNIDNQFLASIPINEIIGNKTDATVVIHSGGTSFKVNFVWII